MQRSFSLALSVVFADDVDDTVPIVSCSILHLQKHFYVLVLRRADNKIICQKTFYSQHH